MSVCVYVCMGVFMFCVCIYTCTSIMYMYKITVLKKRNIFIFEIQYRLIL